MNKYKVTFEMWRETWSGYDQRDGEETVTVKASSEKAAINKAIKKRLNPGKGKCWSHDIWTKNEVAEKI